MQEYHRRVTSVTPVPHGEETTTALLTGATLIPLADSGDFGEFGGHVRILGEIYAYSTMDEGDVSGVPSITLESGLLADVPAESIVEEWNDVKGEVVTDWIATVTDEIDGSTNTAYLTHALIALIASGIALVGESVTVRADDDGTWWLTEVHGATPGYDPGFIRTGGLGADTVVWAGTENGRRAQLDGIDGALEAFNSSNVQTVNIDGDVNYIEGTLATAASGARVEIGPGLLGGDLVDEVRVYSGDADEAAPGYLRARFSEPDPGITEGEVVLSAQEWDGVTATTPSLTLNTGSTLADTSIASLQADQIHLSADGGVSVALSSSAVTVSGNLSATMGTGSVGTGTFRDSVDARVTAVAPGAVPAASETVAGKAEIATQAETDTGTDDARIVTPLKMATYAQPKDADLTAIAALTSAADKLPYATGAGTWALADLTSIARAILDDATVADVRTTILARDRRPTVNTQTGTTYTLALTDEGKIVQVSNAATHTLTIPANASVAFAIGTELEVFRLGAGAVTIAPDAGVTINSRGGLLSINGQYGSVRLRKRLSDTWVLTGDLV